MDHQEVVMETPSLAILRRIDLGEVMPNVGLLQQIAAANWNDKLTADDLLNEIRQGSISVWRVEGTESGLALLRVEQSPTRRVLILDGLAGHNVVTKGQTIKEDLKTIARWFGCASVETSAQDLRWNFVAKRLGFEVAAVVYHMRLD
jgi:hypothetical protein